VTGSEAAMVMVCDAPLETMGVPTAPEMPLAARENRNLSMDSLDESSTTLKTMRAMALPAAAATAKVLRFPVMALPSAWVRSASPAPRKGKWAATAGRSCSPAML